MTSPTATRSNETDMGATPAPRPRARLAGALVAAAAGAALALTGCSAGQVTQTSSQAAAINGANVNAGSVMLRNVHLLYPAEGSDYSFERGGSAQISFVVVNNDPANDDTLLSITSDFGRVTLTPATVPAGGSLVAGIPVGQIVLEEGAGEVVTPTTTEAPEPDAEEGNAAPGAGADATGGLTVVLEDLESGVGPGISIRMVFTFENAGDVEVFVPVDAGAELDRDPEATWRTHEAH